MKVFSLSIENHSDLTGSVVLFQKNPKPNPGEHSVAWFAMRSEKGKDMTFSWHDEYEFVWGDGGNLLPGEIFSTSETAEINSDTSSITLGIQEGDARFYDAKPNSRKGEMSIQNASDLQGKKITEGLAMAGGTIFVVEAKANNKVVFEQTPEYWVAFGEFTRGEILAFDELQLAAPVNFPKDIYDMQAVLQENGTWSITEAKPA